MLINYSKKQKEAVEEIRGALTELLACASKTSLDPARIEMLQDTLKALEDIFLVVVVGEFNAGKSSFINALLNTNALEEGVTPTTAQINLIRYGAEEKISAMEKWGVLILLPAPLLQSMSFVDTPGTNTVISEHEVLTRWFLPRADMVLFLTSADRPFSESESKFLTAISEWGKKTVIIINKKDLLQTNDDLNRVVSFVKEHADQKLNADIPILTVSARMAKQARAEMSEQKWAESGFAELERFIQEKMDERSRFVMKMQAAIGIGTKVEQETMQLLDDERKFYQEDRKLADSIQAQVDLYKTDMEKEIARSMKEVDQIFMEIKQRGNDYFDELFKVKNLPQIMRKEKNQLAFQENVLQNLPTEIERKTTEVVEIITVQQQRMIHYIMMQIENRKTQFPGTSVPQQALDERRNLIRRMQATIDEMLDKIEQDTALNIGMKHAQSAVTAGLAIEVSAIGIGAAITIVATTAAADVLGIVAAFWVGIAGFLVLPYYRKKSQKEFTEKINDVEQKLIEALSNEFTDEVNKQVQAMEQALRPFERFVDSSIDSIEKSMNNLTETQAKFSEISKEVTAAN